MIRKLKSGEFRLYSRKKDATTLESDATLALSPPWIRPNSMSAKFSISRNIEDAESPRVFDAAGSQGNYQEGRCQPLKKNGAAK
jgi:hypothetical protein